MVMMLVYESRLVLKKKKDVTNYHMSFLKLRKSEVESKNIGSIQMGIVLNKKIRYVVVDPFKNLVGPLMHLHL